MQAGKERSALPTNAELRNMLPHFHMLQTIYQSHFHLQTKIWVSSFRTRGGTTKCRVLVNEMIYERELK